MPPRIVVDADGLEALAQVLARTKREIELLGMRMDGYEAALGPERVRRSVDRLVSNWSDVQEKLTAELESISGLVSGAACEYRALEESIAAAAAGQPAPGVAGSIGEG